MPGVEGKQLLGAGVGAGTKGVIGGMVEGLSEGLAPGLTSDAVTGGIGYLMADRMGGFFGDFGMGLLIASIGSIVQAPIEALFEKIKPEPEPPPAPAPKAGYETWPTADDVDLYLASTYGIK